MPAVTAVFGSILAFVHAGTVCGAAIAGRHMRLQEERLMVQPVAVVSGTDFLVDTAL